MKQIKPIYLILFLALTIRLIFAFGWHEIWWDSGVYIGMGKYVYSAGESGLWEHIRPPLMPLTFGALWSIGLNPILFGRLLEILLMLGIIWLTYKITQNWINEKTAIIASLIIACSPIFYYLSFHQYTEIPSTFLVLLAIWLTTKEKYLLAGITTGLAFLTKFAPGIFIAIILIYLIINKKWKPAIITIVGFAITTIPYFIWSLITYGGILATFHAAQDAINKALGCNVLRAQPWWQYFWWLIFSETKLHILAIPGIYALYKQWNKKHLLLALSITIPLLYFIQLNCRDYRYLTLFLPFIAIITAIGTMWVFERLIRLRVHSRGVKTPNPSRSPTNSGKIAFTILCVILSIWMLNTSINYYYGNEPQQPDIVAEEYFTYLSDKQIQGEIWTANPIMAAYTDAKLNKIYYPIYNEGISRNFTEYLRENKQKIGAVLMDNCGGGIICPPNDQQCEQQTQQIVQELDKNFKLNFNKQTGKCWYKVWVTFS